jgi:hypothetical protein
MHPNISPPPHFLHYLLHFLHRPTTPILIPHLFPCVVLRVLNGGEPPNLPGLNGQWVGVVGGRVWILLPP